MTKKVIETMGVMVLGATVTGSAYMIANYISDRLFVKRFNQIIHECANLLKDYDEESKESKILDNAITTTENESK